MMYIDHSVMICVGATTEVEALKKALAEAGGKAVMEQAARKKLKARLNVQGPARAPRCCEEV